MLPIRIHPRPDGRLTLYMPQEAALLERVKQLPGVHYHWQDRTWSVPGGPDGFATVRNSLSGLRLRVARELVEPQAVPAKVAPRARASREEPMPLADVAYEPATLDEPGKAVLSRYDDELRLRGYSPKTRRGNGARARCSRSRPYCPQLPRRTRAPRRLTTIPQHGGECAPLPAPPRGPDRR